MSQVRILSPRPFNNGPFRALPGRRFFDTFLAFGRTLGVPLATLRCANFVPAQLTGS
jgi:hypothetical protein